MIICPNCNHQNPEGSVQCESCYTSLPSTSPCPNCGAMVQTDATFCGQCGFNLQNNQTSLTQDDHQPDPWEISNESTTIPELEKPLPSGEDSPLNPQPALEVDLPGSKVLDPFANNEQIEEIPQVDSQEDDLEAWLASMQSDDASVSPKITTNAESIPDLELESLELEEVQSEIPSTSIPDLEISSPTTAGISTPENIEPTEIPTTPIPDEDIPDLEIDSPATADVSTPESINSPEIPDMAIPDLEPDAPAAANPKTTEALETTDDIPEIPAASVPEVETTAPASANTVKPTIESSTRLQLQKVSLLHVQTGTVVEIPLNLAIVRIGKPNTQVPPDIDVSGFPNAEIVSRVHAEIRIEGDTYFAEDRGSSNGTYINHSPLLTGNRHRLRKGDRLSLGKGDLMTFIFQLEQIS